MEYPFSSSALCAVDNAGRVSLPAFVRWTMARRSDAAALMIGVHDADPCLRGYDRPYAATLHADLERTRLAEGGDAAHHARARHTFGFVEEAAWNEEGEILLPPMMRRKGRIEALALFVGAGGTFEIWNPRLALESDDEGLREVAAWRLDENSNLVN